MPARTMEKSRDMDPIDGNNDEMQADYQKITPSEKEESGCSLKSVLGVCIGLLCTGACCGLAVVIIIVLVHMGTTGLAILGGAVGVFIFVFVVLYCLHQFVIEGNSFNLFSYWLAFVKYAIASQMNGEEGVRDFWKKMESEPGVAEGIGPNTKTFTSWEKASAMLGSWSARIADDTMVRHNELGTALMGPGPWPETNRICLAFDREEHAIARPYVAGACDGARTAEGPCDGSNGWNRTYLRQFWATQFDRYDTFNTTDTLWWCTIVLHKLLINYDMTEEEARAFMRFPSCLSFPGVGKMGVGLGSITDRECPLIGCCTPLPCFRAKVQEHADFIKDGLLDKYPSHDWDDEKLTLVAWEFMDALLYAGGLSVPTIIQNMLAHWFQTKDRPADLDRVNPKDPNSIEDFMWETMRRNPPVAGVPRWVTDDGGETYQHEVANVEQAMNDASVFPEPMEFKMGRPGLCSSDKSRSLFWADPTIANNNTCDPDSHVCPGKWLSVDMCVTFFEELLKREWTTDKEDIQVTYNLTTSFDLTQV